jgi:hypothetical protein
MLALLTLAPLAQAGMVFGGRDLTPPPEFLDPGRGGQVGVRVHPTLGEDGAAYGGLEMAPSPEFINPGADPSGVMLFPDYGEAPTDEPAYDDL